MSTATLSTTLAGASITTTGRITDAAGFAALQEDWGELLAASDSNCLFLTWEWLHTWWKHLAGDRKLSILTVRSAGKLVALAPCCVRTASLLRRRPLPVLEFLGNGWVGSDYLDLIVRRGYEAEARSALLGAIEPAQQAATWTQLRRGDCFASEIAADLMSHKWQGAETVINVCPFISLNGASWEEYLATLGSEHRYNFNRKWRRLNRDYRVTFDAVDREEQCGESVDLAIELHNLRWRGRGKSDAFHTAGLVEFHREFSRIALRRGWLRLYVLRLDDKPVACLYGFLYGGKFYFYQSGFDPAYQKQSVGLVSMGLGIKSAIEEGATEYDLLHGKEEYKSHWSRETRELSRLELYPPTSAGRICRRTVELERAAKRLARRVLPGRFA